MSHFKHHTITIIHISISIIHIRRSISIIIIVIVIVSIVSIAVVVVVIKYLIRMMHLVVDVCDERHLKHHAAAARVGAGLGESKSSQFKEVRVRVKGALQLLINRYG